MSELQKPFPKKSVHNFFKKTENQGQNAACEQQKLARKRKTRPRMNNEWVGKTI